MYRKKQGRLAEEIVCEEYIQRGWKLLTKNFTIRGGEIDVVMESESMRVYIEVKAVNYIDELSDFLTTKKKKALIRTIHHFAHRFPTEKVERIDVVFVKQKCIFHIFENIDIT